MQRYLDQISLSLRPASVVSADGMLRRFAGYLTANHPEIEALVDVDRSHIEAFKRYLPTRAGKNGRPPLSPQTIRMTLGTGSASVSALRHLDDPWMEVYRPTRHNSPVSGSASKGAPPTVSRSRKGANEQPVAERDNGVCSDR